MKYRTLRIIISQLLIFALVVIWLSNIAFNAVVVSASMEPLLPTGSRILANRLAYRFNTKPERFDLVLFKDVTSGQLFAKRVIGLPGETIEIKDAKIYIDANPEALSEDYLMEDMEVMPHQVFTIPNDSYFLLGDNRNHSYDSRYWAEPYVHRDSILGRVWVLYQPLLKFCHSRGDCFKNFGDYLQQLSF